MGKYQNSIRQLVRWFERQKRVLPWRDRPEVYRVWVSEIMLQQTQVKTVIPYFENFVQQFPTVHALAQASPEKVMKAWAGLGYYSRARHLHRAAQQISKHGFPNDRPGWLQVPGVGEYTAGAILSIAYDQYEAILDGNVERVLSRFFRNPKPPKDSKKRLWRLSRGVVRRARKKKLSPSQINQALMELGALVCTPKSPKCGVCVLKKTCWAFLRQEASEYPKKSPRKKTWIQIQEKRFLILDSKNQALLVKGEGKWRKDLWDLPEKLPRNRAAWGLQKIAQSETRHVVTRHQIHRMTEIWKMKKRPLQASESSANEARWMNINEVENVLPVGSAFKRTLSQIRESYFEGGPIHSKLRVE